jgi:hypothetical protein
VSTRPSTESQADLRRLITQRTEQLNDAAEAAGVAFSPDATTRIVELRLRVEFPPEPIIRPATYCAPARSDLLAVSNGLRLGWPASPEKMRAAKQAAKPATKPTRATKAGAR